MLRLVGMGTNVGVGNGLQPNRGCQRRGVASGLVVLVSAFAWLGCEPGPTAPPSTQVSQHAVTTGAATPPARPAPGRHKRHDPTARAGELLVKFRRLEHARELQERAAAQASLGIATAPEIGRAFQLHGVHHAHQLFAGAAEPELQRTFRLVASGDTEALTAALRASPNVEYAEPNLLAHVVFAPNDTYYATTGAWGQSFRDLWALQNISAPSAWDITKGAGILVAVVDTGIDYTHPDIAANIWQNPGEVGTDSQGRDKRSNGIDDDGNGYIDDWRGYNFVSAGHPTGTNDPNDDFGHGTHVAGTVAAVANNATGIVGVAPSARVMAVKALDQNGSGATADLANAIYYAAKNGARVINMSWGGASAPTPQTLLDAITYAHDIKGVVLVAAAGNNSADVGTQDAGFFPACFRNVIAVSAFTHDDQLASFSNLGPKIDLAAPGGGDSDPSGTITDPIRSILSLLSTTVSADLTESGSLIVGGRYLRQAGTSMASPHVAGAAALVLAKFSAFSPEQVRQALRAGADDVAPVGFDTSSGYGRLNARNPLNQSGALAVQLTGPVGTLSAATAAVTGTVAGSGLASWKLEYGAGALPTGWATMATGTAAVTNATIASWNLSSIADGVYTLRLSGTSTTAQTFTDRMVVTLDHLIITAPNPRITTTVRAGVLTVTGTVNPGNFVSYRFDIVSATSGPLINPHVTLTNNGTQPVSNSILGTWDTTGLPTDHYTLHVHVTLSAGVDLDKAAKIIVDPTLHPGWPLEFNTGFVSTGVGNDSFTAADVDGDGKSDLIFTQFTSVNIVHGDGSPLTGWPQPINGTHADAITQDDAAVGDLTGDGKPEVVGSNNMGQIFAWQADGTLLPGWPVQLQDQPSVNIADVDGDGHNEVVVTAGFTLTVLDKTGHPLPGWPIGNAEYPGFTAVADLDSDGKKEIVVESLTAPSDVYVYSSTGVLLSGWPRSLSAGSSHFQSDMAPALADLDGDGKLEIIAGGVDGLLNVFRVDGTQLPGWPRQLQSTPINAPAVGDVDGDGKLDIVVGQNPVFDATSLTDFLYVLHADGSIPVGWPVSRTFALTDSVSFFGFGAPAIADIDGDGKNEVIASSDATSSAPAALVAYRSNGTLLPGYPKPTADIGSDGSNVPTIADFDGDGLQEMAWINDQAEIVLWDLPASSAASAPWPMFAHDPGHTHALVVSRPDLVVTGLSWTPTNPQPGQAVTFSATVKNQGAGATPAGIIIGVAFNVDGTEVTWSDNHTQSLAPGASVTLTANAGNSGSTWTASGGNHTVQAWVDDINRIGESDESNNKLSAPLIIGADLIVTALSWSPGSPVPGEAVTFTATVKNQGTVATPNGVVIGVAFNVDGTEVTWSDNSSASLGAGQSRTLTANSGSGGKSSWTATAGSHTILAWVDDVNRIAEVNDSNNQLSKNLTVAAALPDFVVTAISWSPVSPTRGSAVRFSATVKNQGTGRSPAGVVTGVAFWLDGVEVSWEDNFTQSIAAGGTVNLSANASPSGGGGIWTATSGAHALQAIVDDVNRVTESNEGNNSRTSSLSVP